MRFVVLATCGVLVAFACGCRHVPRCPVAVNACITDPNKWPTHQPDWHYADVLVRVGSLSQYADTESGGYRITWHVCRAHILRSSTLGAASNDGGMTQLVFVVKDLAYLPLDLPEPCVVRPKPQALPGLEIFTLPEDRPLYQPGRVYLLRLFLDRRPYPILQAERRSCLSPHDMPRTTPWFTMERKVLEDLRDAVLRFMTNRTTSIEIEEETADGIVAVAWGANTRAVLLIDKSTFHVKRLW